MIPKRRRQLKDISKSRIETELEVKAYLQNLNYALDNGAKLSFCGKSFCT
jgi:hypothetical protein